ncbi:MAG: hypothetical protein L3J75_03425 [Methylococcaceae bacterium]|nr:hypothetical protein [Methylococcaceae bacterium]
MYELIKLFFSICLLKKGPQDIPASIWLLRLLIIVYVCVNFLILIISTDVFNAVLQVFVEVLLILGLTWMILFFASKLARFQQTVSALMATDALISFLALPAMATLVGQGTAMAFFAIVLLMLWQWLVSGHIFNNALDQPFTFGLGIAFLYILFSYIVMDTLFFVQIQEG